MEEKKKLIKQSKIMIAMALVIVLALAGTYAWMMITRTSTVVNKITAGTLDLILDESSSDGIHLEKQVPMSFQQGLTTTPYTFKIVNNATTPADYTISLEDYYEGVTIPTEGKFEDSKIRYILLKDDETPVGSNSKLLSAGRGLTSGTIQGSTEVNYTLYMWIDSKAGIEVNNQIFSGRLNITAEQVKPKYTLTGKLGDSTGNPIPNTAITITPPTEDPIVATTGSDGTFKVVRVPSGPAAIKSGDSSTSVDITIPTLPPTIELPDGNIITDISIVEEISQGIKELKLGDYVHMTPTSTSYTLDSTARSNKINMPNTNPSELDLWRIISINDDGTYDAVSEYVSSTMMEAREESAYKTFIGYLNLLAKQYENSKYTVGSRHMGYNGQTEYMTTSIPTSVASFQKSSTPEVTDGVGQEYGDGLWGDTLYIKDYNLVKNALGTVNAKSVSDKTTNVEYWLASRVYTYNPSEPYYIWGAREVTENDDPTQNMLRDYWGDGWEQGIIGNYIRPIVVFKSDVSIASGSGTADSPYEFE